MPEVTTDHAATNGTTPAADPKIFVEKEEKAKPAEPALVDRRAELTRIAEGERAKQAARNQERAERAQLQERAARAEAERAQLQERLAAFERDLADPIALLEKRGITPRDLGERILKRGTPEEQIAQAIAKAKEADDKLEALRSELAQRDARAQQEMTVMSAKRALLATFDGVKDKMPILSKMGTERVVSEYLAVYHSARQNGVRDGDYTDAEYLEAAETKLRQELEERLESDAIDLEVLEKHLTRRKGSASVKVETASVRQDDKNASSSRTAKTLTTAIASGSSGSSWKPDNWDKLSDKAQNKILTERIEKGLPLD